MHLKTEKEGLALANAKSGSEKVDWNQYHSIE